MQFLHHVIEKISNISILTRYSHVCSFIHTFAYLSYLFIQFIHTFISPFPCSLLTSLSLLCSLPTSLSPSLVPSLPCSLLPSLLYLSRCALLLTGKLLSSLLCCELNRGQQMREKHALRRHGSPSLPLNCFLISIFWLLSQLLIV